jgi:hypothetical protein
MSEDRTIPEDDWTPAVTLDLYSATSHTFAEIEARFKEWLKNQPLPPLDATTGWEEITPRRAEAWLMRNYKNRKAVFAAIQAYSVPVINGHWMRTGQPIIFTNEGVLLDGQHRLWACYLANRPIPSFVVTDVPHHERLFAFIDNVRPRSGADALYIAGVDGFAPHINMVIKTLALRYDNGLLRVRGVVPMPAPSPMDILAYVQEHPDLLEAAKLVHGNYKSAAKRLDDKLVATFLAWKIIGLHGEDALDRFMTALVSNSLPEGDPVGALQKRLDRHERAKFASPKAAIRKDVLHTKDILAYAIKAFNLMVIGRSTKGLTLLTDEAFPQLVDPSELPPQAEAAE